MGLEWWILLRHKHYGGQVGGLVVMEYWLLDAGYWMGGMIGMLEQWSCGQVFVFLSAHFGPLYVIGGQRAEFSIGRKDFFIFLRFEPFSLLRNFVSWIESPLCLEGSPLIVLRLGGQVGTDSGDSNCGRDRGLRPRRDSGAE